MKLLHALACVLLLTGNALAYPHLPVPPVDESHKDPALQDVRNALLAAVLARNVDAAVRIATPDIHLGFDGASGHHELRRRLSDPKAKYWSELEGALRMGGRFHRYDNDSVAFWAPYTWGAPDTESVGVDPFAAYVVIGRDVRVRRAPSPDAEVIGVMSHEVVKDRCWEGCGAADRDNPHWQAVALPDGRPGWIAKRYLRHLLDLRLSFERIDGRWRWTAALAGD